MTKDESVSARLAQLVAAESQAQTDAISGAVDDGISIGVASVPVTVGGFTQDQVDAAVAQAKVDQKALDDADLQASKDADAQALSDAVKAGQDQVAALQVQYDALKAADDALVAKEGPEASKAALFDGLQSSKDALQAIVNSLQALLTPPAP